MSEKAYRDLAVMAASYDDAQRTRIRNGNRFKAMSSGAAAADDLSTMMAERTMNSFRSVEEDIKKDLIKTYRREVEPEIRLWAKGVMGLGEQQLGQLLGAIGHPRHAMPHLWMEFPPEGHVCGGTCTKKATEEKKARHLVAGEPFERSLRQLWAYCGMGDPERKRKKGQTSEEAMGGGKPQAKKTMYLIALSIVKKRCVQCAAASTERKAAIEVDEEGKPAKTWAPPPADCTCHLTHPYRHVYDNARMEYLSREDWSDLRRMNAALRKTSKELLRGLWIAAAVGEIEVSEAA